MNQTPINNIIKIVGLPALIAGMVLIASPCFALSLNVNPFNGSSLLSFTSRGDALDEVQEVRIKVTGETGNQYQIFQRLEDAFTNENGESLNRSVIEVSSLQGSNSFGTPYLQGIEKLGFSDQLVYTSNSNGAADSLTVAYKIDPALINRSGTFLGRIIYILRPLNGGSQDEVSLNVQIETKGELKVESESLRGQHLIILDTKKSEDSEAHIRLLFSENLDGDLKVSQEVIQMPVNEKQEELQKEVLEFFTANAEIGQLEFHDPTILKQDKELLYTTDASADAFDVYFRLNQEKLNVQPAGHYPGKVRYTFETDKSHETLDVDLDITIQPIFDLTLSYPSGGVDFENLLPTMPAQVQEVVVTVRSNLGKPYSVIQDISGGLSNPQGDVIKKDLFKFKTEITGSNAGKAIDQFESVHEGSSSIFNSDDKGSSSEFKVIYQIQPYRDMQPGDYSLPVKYSLSEI